VPAGNHLRWLAAILTASVMVDLFFFTGFIASDDVIYSTAARRLAETGGLWPQPASHEVRLAMLGWCALVGALVGHDVQALAASFVVFHQLSSLLSFFLARELRGVGAGLLAALLCAGCPVLVLFSTTILPDTAMAACFLAAFLAVLRAGHPGRRPLPARVLLLAAGACLGLAYLCKESGLVPLPFFAAWLLFREARDPRSGRLRRAAASASALFAGLAGVLVLEAAALRLFTGDWVWRPGWTFAEYTLPVSLASALATRATLLWHTLAATPGSTLALLAGGLALGARGARTPLAFAAWFVAYHTWGSLSFVSYYPPSLQPRYLIPALPFLLVAAACAGVALLSGPVQRATSAFPRGRLLALGLGAVVALPAAWVAARACDREAGRLYGAPMVAQTLRALRAWGGTPVVVAEPLGRQVFPLLRERPAGVLFSHEVGPAELDAWRRSDGFVLIDLHGSSGLCQPALNPLLRWPHGLPPSGRRTEGLVAALMESRVSAVWSWPEVDVFERLGRRSTELLALAGVASALRGLERRPDRGVVAYRVAPQPVGSDGGSARAHPAAVPPSCSVMPPGTSQ
jgi:4-amino-4-deoxy-L-arabinose transferase-like glycosyltransferase